MQKTKKTGIRVKFYLENGHNVFAYFPDLPADHEGNKTSYSHIGQHSACSPNYVKGKKLATPEQYRELLEELIKQGYDNLKVIDSRHTLTKIICPVNCKYGAPMGRANVGKEPTGKKIFDSPVKLSEGYDKGGAYWGNPSNLRVRYTKNLQYINFYRQ